MVFKRFSEELSSAVTGVGKVSMVGVLKEASTDVRGVAIEVILPVSFNADWCRMVWPEPPLYVVPLLDGTFKEVWRRGRDSVPLSILITRKLLIRHSHICHASRPSLILTCPRLLYQS